MRKNLPNPTQLYRFISLEEFLAIIELKKERYVRPQTWEDTYEGFFFSGLNNPTLRRKTVDSLLQCETFESAKQSMALYNRTWLTREMQYAKCWTIKSETDALWRIYSYNDLSLRISSTVHSIKKTLPSTLYSAPHIRKVEYDIDNSPVSEKLQTQQFQQMMEDKEGAEPYYHKRVAFSHEDEVRVLVTDRAFFLSVERMNLYGIEERLREINFSKIGRNELIDKLCDICSDFIEQVQTNEVGNSIEVALPHVNSYIRSVMVNPFAPNWYVEIIEELCRKHHIKFLGKSKLYSVPEM